MDLRNFLSENQLGFQLNWHHMSGWKYRLIWEGELPPHSVAEIMFGLHFLQARIEPGFSHQELWDHVESFLKGKEVQIKIRKDGDVYAAGGDSFVDEELTKEIIFPDSFTE